MENPKSHQPQYSHQSTHYTRTLHKASLNAFAGLILPLCPKYFPTFRFSVGALLCCTATENTPKVVADSIISLVEVSSMTSDYEKVHWGENVARHTAAERHTFFRHKVRLKWDCCCSPKRWRGQTITHLHLLVSVQTGGGSPICRHNIFTNHSAISVPKIHVSVEFALCELLCLSCKSAHYMKRHLQWERFLIWKRCAGSLKVFTA